MSAKEDPAYRLAEGHKRTAARLQREDVDRRAPALAVVVCSRGGCYGVSMARVGGPLPACPRCGAGEMGRNGIAGPEGAAAVAQRAGGE